MFDADYLPESKVEPEVLDSNTMFTITESMGSNLGEISFPSIIKDEPNETVGQVLASHSPSCQLRCGLEHRLQTMLDTQFESLEPEPSPTMEYSSDDTILLTPPRQTSNSQQNSPVSSQDVTPDQVQLCSQDVTSSIINSMESAPNSQDVTNTDLQDVTNIEEQICSQDITSDNAQSDNMENSATFSRNENDPYLQDIADNVDIVLNPPDEMYTSVEPDNSRDCVNNKSQSVTNSNSVCQEVISIFPEDIVNLQDPVGLPEPQLGMTNITPELTIQSDNGVPVEKSVTSPSTSSFNIGDPNSGTLTPTVIEPQYRSSDDNMCDLNSANERHNNTSLSA